MNTKILKNPNSPHSNWLSSISDINYSLHSPLLKDIGNLHLFKTNIFIFMNSLPLPPPILTFFNSYLGILGNDLTSLPFSLDLFNPLLLLSMSFFVFKPFCYSLCPLLSQISNLFLLSFYSDLFSTSLILNDKNSSNFLFVCLFDSFALKN